jgi:hypothetical protein
VASSPPVATAASSAASSIGSGAPSAASGTCGVNFYMGTAAGMSLPSASAPVKKKTSALATTTTLWGILKPQQSTYPQPRWPRATQLQQPALRTPPEGQEWTPRWAAQLLPPPPP